MGIFNSPNGDSSSKRIIGTVLVGWFLLASTLYMICVQLGGEESATTENILLSALGGGVTMIVGGVLDGLFNNRSNINKQKKDAI